jgi:glutamine amidotransferase
VHLASASTREPKIDRALFKVPHVGWNSLELPRTSALMSGVPDGAQVYFTHSYVAPVGREAAAVTCYGMRFAAAVEHGSIAGVQFHPEKSGDVGLRILANWRAMCA